MAATTKKLASGPGWSVADVICEAGPGDRRYEEQHIGFSVAAVMAGHFRYRSPVGEAVMAPGAMLLGNDGGCFECSHDHSRGDRCLAFHFDGGLIERIAASTPGVRTAKFVSPRAAPHAAMQRLFAEAEVARDLNDVEAFRDLAARFATAALVISGGRHLNRAPSNADERRVAAAQRLIDLDPARPIDLDALASEANTSPFHFLRVFRQVVGLTPHQYVLQARMRRAAVQLRTSREQVSAIAFDAGFNDLSTFNRRFKRLIGETPGQFRSGGRHAFAGAK